MSRTKTTIIAFAIAATFLAVVPSEANADGPLRRWWRGLHTPRACCATPPQQCCDSGCGSVGTTANYAPNASNLQPGQCMKTCPQKCSRTVVNYVPYTAYRTVQKRVPVTQYKPVTKSDPCTGCVVTCMKPCTTYTYQCQRVPYTTYRPCYRQETFTVPVTTITNDCSTGSCGPCNTCDTGCNTCTTGCNSCETSYQPSYNYQPQTGCSTCTTGGCNACGTGATTNPAPLNYAPTALPAPSPSTETYYESYPANGVITTDGGYGSTSGSTLPADQSPSLLEGVNPQSSQRPVLDRFNSGSGSYNYQTSTQRELDAPARINIEDKTAHSPVRKQWSYSPVRMASHTNSTTTRAQNAPQSNRSLKPIEKEPTVKRNGWVEVN
jgi:hypothetical protein